MLRAVCCMVHAARCTLYIARCMSHIARCMYPAARCTLARLHVRRRCLHCSRRCRSGFSSRSSARAPTAPSSGLRYSRACAMPMPGLCHAGPVPCPCRACAMQCSPSPHCTHARHTPHHATLRRTERRVCEPTKTSTEAAGPCRGTEGVWYRRTLPAVRDRSAQQLAEYSEYAP